MQEDDPDTVSAYLEFIYSRSVSFAFFTTDKAANDHTMMRLIRLYIFGEKIQDDDFCDEVLRTVGTRCDTEDSKGHLWFPVDIGVRSLYDGTPSNSPARRFVVDLHLRRGHKGFLQADIDKHHPEFLLDLALRFLRYNLYESDQSVFSLAEKWSKKKQKEKTDKESGKTQGTSDDGSEASG